MKVGDLMRRVPRHCSAADTAASAGRTMAETGIGALPVVSAELVVSGVLTDRDVCCVLSQHAERAQEVLVSEAASSPAWTCRADDELSRALATMRQHRVRRLPVVDEADRLEGLLSLDEVILAAQALAGGRLEVPVYTEVLETLKVIVGPPPALEKLAVTASAA
jgi:CBS domain-containing protein